MTKRGPSAVDRNGTIKSDFLVLTRLTLPPRIVISWGIAEIFLGQLKALYTRSMQETCLIGTSTSVEWLRTYLA